MKRWWRNGVFPWLSLGFIIGAFMPRIVPDQHIPNWLYFSFGVLPALVLLGFFLYLRKEMRR